MKSIKYHNPPPPSKKTPTNNQTKNRREKKIQTKKNSSTIFGNARAAPNHHPWAKPQPFATQPRGLRRTAAVCGRAHAGWGVWCVCMRACVCVCVCTLPRRAAQAPYHCSRAGCSACSALAVSAGSHHPAGWLGLGCPMAPLQPWAAAQGFPAREATQAGIWAGVWG